MERITKHLKVDKTNFDVIKVMLEAGTLVQNAGRDEVLFQQTIPFDDEIEMDIKVVNSEDGPWTEGVLFFRDAHVWGEAGCTEVGDSLEGEFIVPYDDVEYCVVIERE